MSADYDLSRIGIQVTEEGTGPKCKVGDWTTVHWTGYLKDGREITDSRSEPGGAPKVFDLGSREVFHCWDLAIPQLKQGTKARISCPSYYAYGGAYTQAPLGGEPIPLNSDIDFDIEVVECNRTPVWVPPAAQPHTTTMQPNRCMYIHSDESASESTPLVLTCEAWYGPAQSWWKYWPSAWCYLDEWVKEKEDHQWYYYEDTKSIKNGIDTWGTLGYQGGSWWGYWLTLDDKSSYNINYTYSSWKKEIPEFTYEPTTMTLESKKAGTDITYRLTPQHIRKWGWAELIPYLPGQGADVNANAKFRLEYCWKNF